MEPKDYAMTFTTWASELTGKVVIFSVIMFFIIHICSLGSYHAIGFLRGSLHHQCCLHAF